MGSEACECGSGYRNMGLMSGSVELYHEAHPIEMMFDDGPHVIMCPEMHFGPYQVYSAPESPKEKLTAALEEMADAAKELEKLVTQKDPPAPEEGG